MATTPYNAEAHGDRQNFAALQASGGSPSSPSPAPGGSGALSPPGPPGGLPPGVPSGGGADIFGPSTNPAATPASTGTPPAQIPDDPDLMLRVMYAAFPHPDLLRLIQRRTGL